MGCGCGCGCGRTVGGGVSGAGLGGLSDKVEGGCASRVRLGEGWGASHAQGAGPGGGGGSADE